LLLVLLAAASQNCSNEPEELPILSPKKEVNGEGVHEKIPDYSFVNQDSQIVTPATFENKAYVADFFFTSCPTICPVMTQNMLRIYRKFEQDSRLLLLSHTIDPARDSVGQLKHYADNIGVSGDKWHFVTGNKDDIYGIADDYFNVIVEDPTLPEGFDHSGRLVLVDENRHIRAYCNGTDREEVDLFIKDIERLLHEMESSPDADR